MSGFYDGPVREKIVCCKCGTMIWEPTPAVPEALSWNVIKYWHFPSPYAKLPTCKKCADFERALRAKERPQLIRTQLRNASRK